MKIKFHTPLTFTLTLALLVSFASQAQAALLFTENFEVPPGIELLGNENGWQSDFNDPAPSMGSLAPRNTMGASPFSPIGLALQLTNSKQTTHRKIDDYTDKRIYFSYSVKYFAAKGNAVLRFRTDNGNVAQVGMIDGKFGVETGRDIRFSSQVPAEKVDYFIAGYFESSHQGTVTTVVANAYTDRMSIPNELPTAWASQAKYTLGAPKIWNGIELRVGSSNAAFDCLRIGTEWADVVSITE